VETIQAKFEPNLHVWTKIQSIMRCTNRRILKLFIISAQFQIASVVIYIRPFFLILIFLFLFQRYVSCACVWQKLRTIMVQYIENEKTKFFLSMQALE